MTRALIFTFFFAAIFLVACKSKKEIVKTDSQVNAKETPAWVQSRPISSMYFVGIGVAQKRFDPVNYADVAKRNALNDLASEISVDISANSLLFSLERNNRFKEDYLATTRLNTSKSLSNYEVVDSYETPTAYYIYYRLLKQSYFSQKEQRVNQAKQRAINFYTLGQEDAQRGDYISALRRYLRAVQSIEDYLSDPLEVYFVDGQSFLGNVLLDAIERTISSVEFDAPYQFDLTFGKKLSSDNIPVFTQTIEGKKMSNVPVKIFLQSQFINEVNSTSSGRLIFDITKIPLDDAKIILKFELNKNQMLGDEMRDDPILNNFVNILPTPTKEVFIRLQRPKLFIQSNEKNLDMASRYSLKSEFERLARENNYEVVSNLKSADIKVLITANTRRGGENFGMYSTVLDGQIEALDLSTEKRLILYPLNNFIGSQLNYEEAGIDAYMKVQDNLRKQFFPQFNQAIF